MSDPVVLIHGYSDRGRSFNRWRGLLEERGYDVASVHIGNYVSLTNEVTLKDIAEGFDRALRHQGISAGQPFDAIVHSTGMLVVRAWLASYVAREERASRLRRLIALAPASFGSPLAHKGRSWLGSIFKGSKVLGPDFLEAGDEVLYALELASRFTWDLAHQDLVGPQALFGSPNSPFVFTFCGNRGYHGIQGALNPDGSDGTVRWAGCPLNTRKIVVDLLVESSGARAEPRIRVQDWCAQDIPLIPVADADHGSILREPSEPLISLVFSALRVENRSELASWLATARRQTAATHEAMRSWQQFIIRVVDERGDPVPDWNVQLFSRWRGRTRMEEFDLDVHKYSRDTSLRCFHVDLDRLQPQRLEALHLKLLASSGTGLVAYHGAGSERVDATGRRRRGGKWDAKIDLSSLLGDSETTFFYPFTTTLLELQLNREPMPVTGRNNIFWFSE